MNLDEKRVEVKIQFIKTNLEFLETLRGYAGAEFKGDQRNFFSVVHALQVSIEAMLDILGHIVARLHLGAPTNDREILENLLQKNLVRRDHFERYFQMNKFRNKVVHGYLDVDAHIVYRLLQDNLAI